mmetsp:Transcript_32776/g.74884  ORF Transcript_32776/g.74884 Transcript_32776/m.74884 type:complete len:256 (-) Transcript_32776:633-1400(-)
MCNCCVVTNQSTIQVTSCEFGIAFFLRPEKRRRLNLLAQARDVVLQRFIAWRIHFRPFQILQRQIKHAQAQMGGPSPCQRLGNGRLSSDVFGVLVAFQLPVEQRYCGPCINQRLRIRSQVEERGSAVREARYLHRVKLQCGSVSIHCTREVSPTEESITTIFQPHSILCGHALACIHGSSSLFLEVLLILLQTLARRQIVGLGGEIQLTLRGRTRWWDIKNIGLAQRVLGRLATRSCLRFLAQLAVTSSHVGVNF